MAWKVVKQLEHLVPAEGKHELDVTMTKRLLGKKIRITIEEEVKECCEKWRRYFEVFGHAEATHCPECGEKL